MKSKNLLLTTLYLLTTSSTCFAVDYPQIVKLMISTGIVSPSVARHNARVYASVLQSIENTIQDKGLSVGQKQYRASIQIQYLKGALRRQIGTVGSWIADAFDVNQIEAVLNDTQAAINRSDFETALDRVSIAKKEILSIQN